MPSLLDELLKSVNDAGIPPIEGAEVAVFAFRRNATGEAETAFVSTTATAELLVMVEAWCASIRAQEDIPGTPVPGVH